METCWLKPFISPLLTVPIRCLTLSLCLGEHAMLGSAGVC
jgi:hypothetical protein